MHTQSFIPIPTRLKQFPFKFEIWYCWQALNIWNSTFFYKNLILNLFLFQIIALALFALVAITEAFPQATERPAISDEQLESTLKDKRYLLRQLKCALGEAACDPVGRRLKSEYCTTFFFTSTDKEICLYTKPYIDIKK